MLILNLIKHKHKARTNKLPLIVHIFLELVLCQQHAGNELKVLRTTGSISCLFLTLTKIPTT